MNLDTSGAVPMGRGENMGLAGINLRWSDLDPFTQGYVEALFADGPFLEVDRDTGTEYLGVGFRHLAPETLAAILKDCETFGTAEPYFLKEPHGGRDFWIIRQTGRWPTFPPLTPYLGDDGKVYLRPSAA